jgi:hypothetical protein
VVAKGKPLAVFDHVMIEDGNNNFLVCGKKGWCKLTRECVSARNKFDINLCNGHILQVKVEGKSPGEYVQEGDHIVLVYSRSTQQWVGTPNGRSFRRLFTGFQSRNSLLSRPPIRTAFQVVKISV